MEFALRMRVVAEGGEVSVNEGVLTVRNANSVVFLIAADTDYKANFNPDFNDRKAFVGVNPGRTTAEWMGKASELGYGKLKEKHLEAKVVVCSAVGGQEGVRKQAMEAGAMRVIAKPFSVEEIKEAIADI